MACLGKIAKLCKWYLQLGEICLQVVSTLPTDGDVVCNSSSKEHIYLLCAEVLWESTCLKHIFEILLRLTVLYLEY